MDTKAELHLAQVQQQGRASIAGHLRRAHRYVGGLALDAEPRQELLQMHYLEHRQELGQ